MEVSRYILIEVVMLVCWDFARVVMVIFTLIMLLMIATIIVTFTIQI